MYVKMYVPITSVSYGSVRKNEKVFSYYVKLWKSRELRKENSLRICNVNKKRYNRETTYPATTRVEPNKNSSPNKNGVEPE